MARALARGRNKSLYVWSAAMRIGPMLASNLASRLASACSSGSAHQAERVLCDDDSNCETKWAKNSGFRRAFKSDVMSIGFISYRTPRDCHHGCLVLREKLTGRSTSRIHFDGCILTLEALTVCETRSCNLIKRREHGEKPAEIGSILTSGTRPGLRPWAILALKVQTRFFAPLR